MNYRKFLHDRAKRFTLLIDVVEAIFRIIGLKLVFSIEKPKIFNLYLHADVKNVTALEQLNNR
ncbi:MAG: hypothetical protein CMA92_02270 [Euryarchaeota archaeon]|nr:hypothetical protein [Euryarchaeota archaeon]